MAMNERIYLFDTTLRDGAQTQGVDFSVTDKCRVIEMLDGLGLDYIEAGWPGANPVDDQVFGDPPSLTQSRLVAFGMTKRAGRSADNDPVIAPLIAAKSPNLCFVGKSWDFHVTDALGVSLEDNLEMIGDTVAYAAARKAEVMYDAEHFFDGYKANPDYALGCLKAAYDNGARWVVLCDTNGGTLPHEVQRIVEKVLEQIPGDRLGVHFHNDTDNAVANSLTAIRAGARQIQGTINGLGERCGNASLTSLIPTLVLKTDFECGIQAEKLVQLTALSDELDRMLGLSGNRHRPYTGANAFAHKGGLHASAIIKDPTTYEHVAPEVIGNKRKVSISSQSGRANINFVLAQIGFGRELSNDECSRVLQALKENEESARLSYDGADASFELFVHRTIGGLPTFFEIDRFRVIDERRHNSQGQVVTEAIGMVQLMIEGRSVMEASGGSGPVDALNKALGKALAATFPQLADMSLSDYSVRIIDSDKATEATTRVLIESYDAQGRVWTCVGVSENVIDASFQALEDAIVWKLMKEAQEL